MAKITHCRGLESRVRAYRLASAKTVYEFQHVWHCAKCKGCGEEVIQWRGEHPDGKFTDWITAPKSEHEHWLKRIEVGEARPEAQLMSEWAERAARPADVAITYQTKLCQAKRWYKGRKS